MNRPVFKTYGKSSYLDSKRFSHQIMQVGKSHRHNESKSLSTTKGKNKNKLSAYMGKNSVHYE